MNELEQLLAALAATDTKIDALLAHDELTKEQRAEHDQLQAERKKTAAAIQKERDRLTRADERAQLAAEVETRKQPRGRRTEEDAAPGDECTDEERDEEGNCPEKEAPAASSTSRRPKVTKPFAIPATAIRSGSLRFFKGTRDGVGADVRAYRFGMWALAQLSIQMPGRFRFNNAIKFFDENHARWNAAHLPNDAAGTSNLIPHEFGTDYIDLREMYGLVRKLFKRVPMTSDTRTDPRREDGLTAYFTNDDTGGTESKMAVDNVGLTAKDLMVLFRIGNNVNADAAMDFGDTLLGEASYAMAKKEDLCGLLGDATSTYGHILGAITRLQSFDGLGTDSVGLITGAGNAYSELVLADFDRTVGILPQFADTPDAAWVMHRSFYYGTVEKLVQASGGVPAYEVREGNRRPRPLFKGYPVEFSPAMPKTEANSQVVALLGDFQQGASFGDRQQETIAFSEHATIAGETRSVFEKNQIATRVIERFDINVHSVGNATDAGAIVGLQTAAS